MAPLFDFLEILAPYYYGVTMSNGARQYDVTVFVAFNIRIRVKFIVTRFQG